MARLYTPPGPADLPRSRGTTEPAITFVEYGDFQCAYCARSRPLIAGLVEVYGDQVQFIFRHFPVRSSHPQAQLAAEAAEVAAEQGKFWPMHDLLFANTAALDPEDLRRYARMVGLDLRRFDEALADRRYEQPVRAMLKAGLRSGVNATPTFFVDGERYDGPVSEESLRRVIEVALRDHRSPIEGETRA